MLAYLQSYLSQPVTPGEAGNYVWATIYVVAVVIGVSLAVLAMNWIERKALAHMQVRLGPMRVGPHGLLQPVADAVKLLIKEDIMPEGADKLVFWAAPVMIIITAWTTFLVVPFGREHAVTDMNIGILFILGVSSLSVLSIVMAGWASNSHYPLLGSLRSSAQMVSYEVAMGLAVICAILMTGLGGTGMYLRHGGETAALGAGTLSMIGIVQAQAAQGTWFIFKLFPLGLAAFVIFAIAMVAETNRAPFDLPEAESELVAGFHTEYSGFRWSLFMLAEYSGMVAVSSIAVTLWLGGWLRPFATWHGPPIVIPHYWQGGALDFAASLLPALVVFLLALVCFIGVARMPKIPVFRIQAAGLAALGGALGLVGLVMLAPPVRDRVQDVFWFAMKVAGFMYLFIWYRATFPRYRFDQLMKVGWKGLLPVALGVVIVTAVVGVLR
jgi:NADH-quinone oxidoreductase subunit H